MAKRQMIQNILLHRKYWTKGLCWIYPSLRIEIWSFGHLCNQRQNLDTEHISWRNPRDTQIYFCFLLPPVLSYLLRASNKIWYHWFKSCCALLRTHSSGSSLHICQPRDRWSQRPTGRLVRHPTHLKHGILDRLQFISSPWWHSTL